MDHLFFWNKWPKHQARLINFLIFGFLITLVGYIILYYTGHDLIFKWEVYNSIKPIQVPVKTIRTGIYDFFLEGPNYVNLQEFVGGTINILILPSVLLSIVFTMAVAIMIAIFTQLSRFWFTILMGITIFLFLALQLEGLELFGFTGKQGFIIAIILFSVPAYYFHAIQPQTRFIFRILAMAGIAVVFLLMIALFSNVDQPFLAFSGYGMYPMVILSIIFIILVAHELITFFLNIITANNNENSKNSLPHFLIITLAYLFLILLSYLYNIRVIGWQLIYLNAFILLMASAILGFWGFKHKQVLYNGIFKFQPEGAILYLVLAISTFVTIGFFFATANDPAIEAFEDFILFIHIGFGIGFFLYVLANFYTLLHQNQQVYKVIYKPIRMPYFTAQLAGLFASLAFYFLSNQISLYQIQSARYNNIAGFHYASGNKKLAKEYYKQGAIYGFRNHLSNFNLASIYMDEADVVNAVYHFHQATLKRPSEQAFINLSHIYNQNESYFESLFTLQDGIKAFPGSGIIANNLALRYNKTDVLDSALFYIFQARDDTKTKEVSEANEIGFYMSKGIYLPLDSVQDLYTSSDNMEMKTHLLGLINQANGQLILTDSPKELHDSLLTINQYAFLQNYLINQKEKVNETLVSRMEQLKANSESFYSTSLSYAEAIMLYEKNFVYQAFEQFQLLKSESTDQENYYAQTLAALALEQMAPELAMEFLVDVAAPPDTEPQYYRLQAISYLMSGNIPALDSITKFLQNDFIFASIQDALGLPFSELDDLGKYYYMIINEASIAPSDFIAMMSKINDTTLTGQILKYVIIKNLDNYNTQRAAEIYGLSHEYLSDEYFRVGSRFRILYQQNQINQIISILPTISGDSLPVLEYLLYSALKDLNENQTEAAEKKFRQLANSNPFFEDGIVEAARFFNSDEDEFLSYNILLQAIRFNKYSKILNQEYILQATKMGLSDYAEEALEQLRLISDPTDYVQFEQKYDSLRQTLTPSW